MTHWLTTLVLAGCVVVAAELGFRLGLIRRVRRKDDEHISTIEGALLGLLAILLGFAFSGAASRYTQREELMTKEATALSTAYLQLDLLAQQDQLALRPLFREYGQARLSLFAATSKADVEATERSLEGLQQRIWAGSVAATKGDHGLKVLFLPAVNEAFDYLTERNSADRRHLPVVVMGLLWLCAVVAMIVVGYGQGLKGQRERSTILALATLVAISLWVTVDLDHPRAGLIQIQSQVLDEAVSAMR